jgi:16S rRNA (uracil1498-N3)-methyltransferase
MNFYTKVLGYKGTMHRFFVPAEWIEKNKVTLMGRVAHQVKNVLRMRPGRKIIILDNSGQEYFVNLNHVAKNVVVGEIYDRQPAEGEPALHLCLYQGMLKAQKFEWVLQKGTELGISEFVPVVCERSVLSDVENIDEKKIRWGRIIREAAEQCGRGKLPLLRPATMFGQACQRAIRTEGLSLIGWEGENEADLKSSLLAVASPPLQVKLFIGSEGGYTLDEVRLASGYNILPVGLGRRILRAETAGLVAAAAIFYQFDALK